MEWELSKENVQPLRKGRKAEIANAALQTEDQSSAPFKLLESQRRPLIQAVEGYDGDDPLQPWLQRIRSVKDAYPVKSHQSELRQVLEACTRTFQEDERYKSDIRYLRVWVLYADLCQEPVELYQFLEARCIGQDHALFYEAYATCMEVCKNHSKANEIYELGLQRGAQPTTRLLSMYQSFLKRMAQRNERKDQQRQHIQQPQVQSSGLEVFVDDELNSGGGTPSISRSASAARVPESSARKNLGTQKEIRKENDQPPARWTESNVLRKGPCGSACDQGDSLSGDGDPNSTFEAPHLVGSEICMDREDGRESSFEEARLLKWKLSNQPPNENTASSRGSATEKAKLIEKSLIMFQCESVKLQRSEKQSPLSRLGDMEPLESDWQLRTIHDGDADDSNQRMSPPSSLPGCTDELVVSFADEPAAFACTIPTSQLSVNGEETVAIKKYAEELITLGADPQARGNDISNHQGLIDPTINTKVCLQDILSMFNRPLSCAKPQRKPRVSKSSQPSPISNEGFEIFVDVDDNRHSPRSQKNGGMKNRGLEIFNDEENDPKHLKKLPEKKGMQVFVDEDEAPPFKVTSLPKKKPFQVFQEENVLQNPGNGSLEFFADEGVDFQPRQTRISRPFRKPTPVAMKGSFDIFVDDDRYPQ